MWGRATTMAYNDAIAYTGVIAYNDTYNDGVEHKKLHRDVFAAVLEGLFEAVVPIRVDPPRLVVGVGDLCAHVPAVVVIACRDKGGGKRWGWGSANHFD